MADPDHASCQQQQEGGQQEFDDDDGEGDEKGLVHQVVGNQVGEDEDHAAQHGVKVDPQQVEHGGVFDDAAIGTGCERDQDPYCYHQYEYARQRF